MAPAKHALRIERRPASRATISGPTFTHDRRRWAHPNLRAIGGASLRRQNSVPDAMELQHELQRAVSFDRKKDGSVYQHRYLAAVPSRKITTSPE